MKIKIDLDDVLFFFVGLFISSLMLATSSVVLVGAFVFIKSMLGL